MAASKPSPSRRGRRWAITLLKLAIFGFIALLGALLIAVFITRASLPDYDALKSSPNGQMVRVHASDGTVIVSLGPSYGEWVPYDRIPQNMIIRHPFAVARPKHTMPA